MGTRKDKVKAQRAVQLSKKRKYDDIIPESSAKERITTEDDEKPKGELSHLALLNSSDDEGEIVREPVSKKQKLANGDNKQQHADTEESIDEKRVKLAKAYIDKIKQFQADTEEADDMQEQAKEDFVAKQLRKAADASKFKLKNLAHAISQKSNFSVQFLKGHHKPLTCVALSSDAKHAYTGSKDCSILHWDVATGAKTVWKGLRGGKEGLVGHEQEILSIAISSDGQYVASAGRDLTIRVWDAKSNTLIDQFKKTHTLPITGLRFQPNSSVLYSSSMDRTVKVWDVKDMAFSESLYGHESEVHALDAFTNVQRALSASMDTTVRAWKIQEETQLIFKGHQACIDCIRLLHDQSFLSGSQDGSVAIWNTLKKKPTAYFEQAHAGEWISSVGCVKNSDLGMSGSCDGYLKLWKCDAKSKQLTLANQIPMKGYINGIDCGYNDQSGHVLVAALGQEHRLGRWKRIKDARNGLAIVKLLDSDAERAQESEQGEDENDDDDEDQEEDGEIFDPIHQQGEFLV